MKDKIMLGHYDTELIEFGNYTLNERQAAALFSEFYDRFANTQIAAIAPWHVAITDLQDVSKFRFHLEALEDEETSALTEFVTSLAMAKDCSLQDCKYDLASDTIHIAKPDQVPTEIHYWVTYFRLLSMWTGHPKRLNSYAFGSEIYEQNLDEFVTQSELAADFTAMIFCRLFNLPILDALISSCGYHLPEDERFWSTAMVWEFTSAGDNVECLLHNSDREEGEIGWGELPITKHFPVEVPEYFQKVVFR